MQSQLAARPRSTLYSIQVLGLAEPVVPVLIVCMAAGALLGVRLSPRLAARDGSCDQRLSGGHLGLSPLGASLAGPLAEATSPGTVYVVAGSIVGFSAILLARPLARD